MSDLYAGTMGLKGDLTAGEIVEQLVHAQRVTTIKNVVYMVGWPPLHDFRECTCAALCFALPKTQDHHITLL